MKVCLLYKLCLPYEGIYVRTCAAHLLLGTSNFLVQALEKHKLRLSVDGARLLVMGAAAMLTDAEHKHWLQRLNEFLSNALGVACANNFNVFSIHYTRYMLLIIYLWMDSSLY
jgi:hypothetical protein